MRKNTKNRIFDTRGNRNGTQKRVNDISHLRLFLS
jgi:hypothetical protein